MKINSLLKPSPKDWQYKHSLARSQTLFSSPVPRMVFVSTLQNLTLRQLSRLSLIAQQWSPLNSQQMSSRSESSQTRSALSWGWTKVSLTAKSTATKYKNLVSSWSPVSCLNPYLPWQHSNLQFKIWPSETQCLSGTRQVYPCIQVTRCTALTLEHRLCSKQCHHSYFLSPWRQVFFILDKPMFNTCSQYKHLVRSPKTHSS